MGGAFPPGEQAGLACEDTSGTHADQDRLSPRHLTAASSPGVPCRARSRSTALPATPVSTTSESGSTVRGRGSSAPSCSPIGGLYGVDRRDEPETIAAWDFALGDAKGLGRARQIQQDQTRATPQTARLSWLRSALGCALTPVLRRWRRCAQSVRPARAPYARASPPSKTSGPTWRSSGRSASHPSRSEH